MSVRFRGAARETAIEADALSGASAGGPVSMGSGGPCVSRDGDVDMRAPRLGAAACKHAELVPLWVGKYDPAFIACLADVGVSGT